jgi:hypothetical protein
VGAPADLYHDGSGVSPDEKLAIDAAAAERIVAAFTTGDAALRRFAPDAAAVLWPEHFDVSATLDDVTYGMSPGDSYLDEPYVYVSPPSPPDDPFFNQSFGAARALRDVGDVNDVIAFFTKGRRILTA